MNKRSFWRGALVASALMMVSPLSFGTVTIGMDARAGGSVFHQSEDGATERIVELSSIAGDRASAFVSLATGQLNASTVAAVSVVQNKASVIFSVQDTIQIIGAVHEPAIGFLTLRVHGDVTRGTGPVADNFSARGNITVVVGSSQRLDYSLYAPGLYNPSGCVGCNGIAYEEREVGLNADRTFRFPFAINTGASIELYAGVIVESQNGGQANFENTFGIELPAGLGFSSESGVFLTQSPVPEPAAMTSSLLGLVILAGWRRIGRMSSSGRRGA